MKVSDIQTEHHVTIELRPFAGSDFEHTHRLTDEVLLYYLEATDEFVIKMGAEVCPVVGADKRSERILYELCATSKPRLCWLAGQQRDEQRIVVQAFWFNARYDLPELVQIGINDEVFEKAQSHLPRGQGTIQDLIRWLRDATVIEAIEGPAALISAAESDARSLGTAFTLHGRGVSVDVTNSTQGGYAVTRISRARRSDHSPVMLIRGTLEYYDATVTGELRHQAQTLLDSIVRQHDSYLGLWHEYNRLERQGVIRQAREFGWLRYRGWELHDGVHYNFGLQTPDREVLDSVRDHDVDLEAAEKLPPEFVVDDRDGLVIDSLDDEETQHVARSFVGRCVFADDWKVVLRVNEPDRKYEPPKEGYIFVSLMGDRHRLERRENAREQISRAANPMPTLGVLLERKPAPVVSHRRVRYQQRDIHSAFGDQEPTVRQKEAIEIALNTPDITVIQGPPGTGKTRVIAAIERILARDSETRKQSDRVLLTSYQHDAVENAALYTVFDIPPIKVGRKRGQDRAEFADTVTKWQSEQIARLETALSAYPETSSHAALRNVRSLAISYGRSPGSRQETADLIENVLKYAGPLIPFPLREQLIETANQLRVESIAQLQDPEEHELLVQAVRSLRTDAVSFSDDGPIAATKLLHRLKKAGRVNSTDLDLLGGAANWDSSDVPDFLADLASMQNRLLDELTQTTALDQAGLIRGDIETLLIRVVDALFERARTSRDGIEVTLEDYLHDLKNDPEGLRRTLMQYTAVLAATCQHSVSLPMDRLRSDLGVEFDTVIVDEAARANPLDLIIPMALAKRRIILVGDHRQLPHILEPDVERQLDLSDESTREAFGKSLFERLFKHFKELESTGAVKRAITLNAQYRMHPILGHFVSDTFYPVEEQFESPLPQEHFAHNVAAYEGKVAVWVNVPFSMGGEKGKVSKYRPVEAQRVAEVVVGIIGQNPDLSVGVITFYSAQEREILKALRKTRIDLIDDTGDVLQVRQQWVRGTDGALIEKLRVGTVDAFQGKEFDVVILSMTRSNKLGEYGFLKIPNRLCVAMSRQKRILIVVGDERMVLDAPAADAVPGLKAFYELCRGEYGLRL